MKQNRQLRHLLLGSFVLLSCLLAAFVLDRYQESAAPSPVDSPPQSTADLSIDSFHYSETRDGKIVWQLNAATAEHDLSTGLTKVKDVRVIFFDRAGFGEMTLAASDGVWQGQERRLRLERDVVLKTQDGYTCFADQLVYTEADSHLRSQGPVRLVSSQVELRGVGLDIDISAKTLQLLADVWSSWNLPELLKEKG